MNTVSKTTVPLHNEVFAANRAVGRIALTVAAGAGGSRPARVHELGSLRVRFPHRDGAALDAVIVNTGGGMTGGDRFALAVNVGAGADVSVTTAAAEKIYRSLGPDTVLDLNLTVASGGRLTWLPQETILFDRARLRRKIDVDLAPDASLLLAEASIFGRSAMGETVRSGSFSDRWRVRVGGCIGFCRRHPPRRRHCAIFGSAGRGGGWCSGGKRPQDAGHGGMCCRGPCTTARFLRGSRGIRLEWPLGPALYRHRRCDAAA